MSKFPTKPDACIFDVDDTLISNYYPDGTGIHEMSRYEAFLQLGAERNIQALLETTSQENHEVVHKSPFHTMEWIAWTLLQEKGLVEGDMRLDDPLLHDIIQLKDKIYHEKITRDGKEIPGAAQFLKQLHTQGTPLAIASGAGFDAILEDLAIIGATGVFDERNIISKEQVAHAKPDPEPFKKALTTLAVNPNATELWAFEDDTGGIASAHGAGLKVCAIVSRFSREQLEKHLNDDDIIIDSYFELLDVVK